MQFGFNLPLSGPSASPAMLARLAAEGEAIGYVSFPKIISARSDDAIRTELERQ